MKNFKHIPPKQKQHLHQAHAALHTVYWVSACATANNAPMLVLFGVLAIMTVIMAALGDNP